MQAITKPFCVCQSCNGNDISGGYIIDIFELKKLAIQAEFIIAHEKQMKVIFSKNELNDKELDFTNNDPDLIAKKILKNIHHLTKDIIRLSNLI